jgi:hypothetical protein
MFPPRAGHFSTLLLLAKAAGKKLAPLALRQFSRRSLRCGGRDPRKISNARWGGGLFWNVSPKHDFQVAQRSQLIGFKKQKKSYSIFRLIFTKDSDLNNTSHQESPKHH